MDNLTVLTAFLGWCSVINIAILLFSTIVLAIWGDFAKSLHAKLFGINPSDMDLVYFKYLAYYKLLILVFNLVPYFALRLIN